MVLWGEAATLRLPAVTAMRGEEKEKERRKAAASRRQSFVIRSALGCRAPAAIGSRRATRNRSHFPLPHCAILCLCV